MVCADDVHAGRISMDSWRNIPCCRICTEYRRIRHSEARWHRPDSVQSEHAHRRTRAYRFSRNPMYIGSALWRLGIAFLVDCAWMLLAVPIGLVLIDRPAITREEHYLERKFGEEYLSYKRRVRRWI
jgi:protein-S-isoprenylcysteine O-methyltransferase Ste14